MPNADVAAAMAAWRVKALGDLAAAELCLGAPQIPGWIVGFHLQQAVEKWLKADLVAAGIEPPHIHDLVRLLVAVRATGRIPSISNQLAADLLRFAVNDRYPFLLASEVDDDELSRYCAAVRQALTV